MVLLRKGRHADFQFNQKKNAVPLLGIRSSISINWACYVFLRLAIFFFSIELKNSVASAPCQSG